MYRPVATMKTDVARAAAAMLGVRRYASRENALARARTHAQGHMHTHTCARLADGNFVSRLAVALSTLTPGACFLPLSPPALGETLGREQPCKAPRSRSRAI